MYYLTAFENSLDKDEEQRKQDFHLTYACSEHTFWLTLTVTKMLTKW